jgi:hypothetical protein
MGEVLPSRHADVGLIHNTSNNGNKHDNHSKIKCFFSNLVKLRYTQQDSLVERYGK